MTLLRCALVVLLACGSRGPAEQAPAGGGSAAAPVAPAKATPVSIAIVIEGWEMWMGNDQLPDLGDDEQYPGALRPLRDVVERIDRSGFPAGSQAAVITYGQGAAVRHPMQSIDTLRGAALGEQKDYFGVVDRDLVAGVKLGLDELAKANTRRVLVVIGDGNDTAPAKAKVELAELAKRAAADKVEVLSFVYASPLSSPAQVIRAFDPAATTVVTVEGIGDQLAYLVARIQQPPVLARGGKGLVLALLVSGSEVWTGNDDFTPVGDPSRYPGALEAIKAAFATPLTGFPPGSRAMVLTYDSSTRVRVPPLPIERLDARAFGGQRDYYGRIGFELTSGVTLAFAELLKTAGERRALVIVGDGTATDNESAKAQLLELAKRAQEHGIEVHAVVWKSQLSDAATVVTQLDPDAKTVATPEAITAALVDIFNQLRKP